ncbi:MAG: ABC transporter ATP-binding protein [Dysgonamonadaceae bacterium]|jgi:zinc transport system ATP-binding protein|nr:ABC transporter ATP-binding protein [Dysgonamonadaceae bacterium]
MNKLIEITQVSAAYGRQTVLRNVSLNVYETDFLGIIGPNGGGKTTLLKLILGLMKPASGTITCCREGLRKRLGYLPQINQIDRKFPILVSEVIASGLLAEEKKAAFPMEEVLHMMGIAEIASKPIGQLSGGQLQRVLLARAMINKPELLILDEPSSFVDKRFESRFYEILETINRNTAIILVSHDVGTIISLVKNIACINETLHYHAGNDISEEWLDRHYACPVDIIGHGDLPHRILKKHAETVDNFPHV